MKEIEEIIKSIDYFVCIYYTPVLNTCKKIKRRKPLK